MSTSSFTALRLLGLVSLLSIVTSCTEIKVDEYPLPRHGGSISLHPNTTPTPLGTDIQNPTTIGAGIGTPANPNVPTLPGDPTQPVAPVAPVTPQAGVTPPTAPVQPPPAPTSNAQGLKYAIPIAGDPYTVLSPYDGKRVNIKQANGKPIPSGKVIRAAGETDPNKKFIIP